MITGIAMEEQILQSQNLCIFYLSIYYFLKNLPSHCNNKDKVAIYQLI
jgi:hypothetical protein